MLRRHGTAVRSLQDMRPRMPRPQYSCTPAGQPRLCASNCCISAHAAFLTTAAGDQDIHTILDDYAAAYTSESGKVQSGSTHAVKTSPADRMTRDKDLPKTERTYAAAYSDASATAQSASAKAVKSTTADWMSPIKDLPTADQSYNSVRSLAQESLLDAAPTKNTADRTQKGGKTSFFTRSVAKETAAINAEAEAQNEGRSVSSEAKDTAAVKTAANHVKGTR